MNILGLPVYQPRGYSINEYDVSTGILRPATIPLQVVQKMPIQRQPRFQLPEVNLSAIDTKMELLKEKLKKEPQYNKMPQLIKLPKDTRISLSEIGKKGQTLYNLYNKIEKEKAKRQRIESKRELITDDPGNVPKILFEEPPAPPSEFEFEFDPVDVPPGMPRIDDDDDFPEGKHETDDPKEFDPTLNEPEGFSLDDPSQWEEVPLDEPEDPSRSWIDKWKERMDKLEEDPAEYSDEWDDLYPEVDHPSSDIHEPETWIQRPIQAIDQYGESFFIPSVVGEPGIQAPERETMEDPFF